MTVKGTWRPGDGDEPVWRTFSPWPGRTTLSNGHPGSVQGYRTISRRTSCSLFSIKGRFLPQDHGGAYEYLNHNCYFPVPEDQNGMAKNCSPPLFFHGYVTAADYGKGNASAHQGTYCSNNQPHDHLYRKSLSIS
ncbi:MAG: hypothetical protein JZU50_13095 [Desulfobulbaceae bacterium]|jgi:hypothetical protein|nr:hypothetical protein [Desulfobulbaceae bacterium]